jgi:predicted kinase
MGKERLAAILEKGGRQTSRHQKALSIIDGPASFKRALEIYGQDPILRHQRIVCREFVMLRLVDASHPTRIPSAFEYRTFWWQGRLIGWARYWWEGKNYQISESEKAGGLAVAQQAASRLRVPFLVVDIAQTQTARCDHLALLAEADVRGRACADQQRLLDNVGLFREYCQEENCLKAPRAFPSDHARFVYFHSVGRHPDVPVHEEFRCEVVLMSGLPGSGKDQWIRRRHPDWPVISLDDVRNELDVDPTDNQGAVIHHSREKAREHLRRGQSFVWNATNLSRQLRSQCIKLFADYHARIRIVYVEVPRHRLFEQNRHRERRVPQDVIQRLLDRWEVSGQTEAHAVEWVVETR